MEKERAVANPKTWSTETAAENMRSREVNFTEDEINCINGYVRSFNSISTKGKAGDLISPISGLP